MENKLRLFEMFAGYGGASFALNKAGLNFECVGYSEINKSAIEIFELNHPNVKNYGDCTKINPEELPDFDLLTGGFPCQPFSVNTHKDARGEVHKSSNLFMDIIRILEIKKPKYVLLENVKGLLGEKSKIIYNKILEELKRVGYNVRVELVNSRDYGTPQNRERVLIICSLENLDFKLPEKEELKLTVEEILEEQVLRREPKISRLRLSKKSNLEKFGDISRLDAILESPVNKRKSNVAFEILDAPSNVVSRQSDRIYHPTYSPCLTATGSDYLYYFNGKVIVLTPKECFRLMGFFKDEINLGKINDLQLHKLAGNGWDINLMSKFLKNLLKGGIKEMNQEEDKNIIIEILNYDIPNKYKIILIKNELS